MNIPPDAAHQCKNQCESVGLDLSAVAIMAGTIGCVCEVRHSKAGNGGDRAASTSAGMATIMMQRQRQQQQQAAQQQQASARR